MASTIRSIEGLAAELLLSDPEEDEVDPRAAMISDPNFELVSSSTSFFTFCRNFDKLAKQETFKLQTQLAITVVIVDTNS